MREFAYGQQYAWMLVIFSVMVVYCITCPLVTPFGKSRNGLVTCQIFSLVTVRKESGKNNFYGRGNVTGCCKRSEKISSWQSNE